MTFTGELVTKSKAWAIIQHHWIHFHSGKLCFGVMATSRSFGQIGRLSMGPGTCSTYITTSSSRSAIEWKHLLNLHVLEGPDTMKKSIDNTSFHVVKCVMHSIIYVNPS